MPVGWDVEEAFEPETETEALKPEAEARPRRLSICPRRDRDRGVHVRDRGETEAFRPNAQAETETEALRPEAEA